MPSDVLAHLIFFTPPIIVFSFAIYVMVKEEKKRKENIFYTAPISPSGSSSMSIKRKKQIFDPSGVFPIPFNNIIYYNVTLSVIALFSWVIKRDGVVDEREMKVANLYFNTYKRYNIFFSYHSKRTEDSIAGHPHKTRRRCEDMLRYYNSCANLLHYKQCCANIIKVGIFYEAALELLNALFQVAYSSDGVINTEREILYGIAQELKIRREDWNELSEKYGFYRTDSEERDWRDSAWNTNQTKYSQYSYSSKGKESSSYTYKNNDGFGEKYQKQEEKQQQEEPKKSASYGYKLTQAYNQLGLLTTASEAEIKSAYRKLAKKYHPDRLSPDATDMDRKISADQFRQIKEAYDLIRLERGNR